MTVPNISPECQKNACERCPGTAITAMSEKPCEHSCHRKSEDVAA